MSAPTKNIADWNSNDFMQFITSIGISGDTYNKIQKEMEDCCYAVSEIRGSAKDIADMFDIPKPLGRKIKRALDAIRIQSSVNAAISYNNNSEFVVNLRGKLGRNITLRRKFTANSPISDVVKAYKDEECVNQHYKVEKIIFLSNGKILQHDKTLAYYGIKTEYNLLHVILKVSSNNLDDEKLSPQHQYLKVTDETDLKLDYTLKAKVIKDESGFNVVPMNIYDAPKPVISFKLDLSYNLWNADMEDDFLSKLAKELLVNKHELVILCKSRGSINLSVLVNAVKTQYHNIRITCSYIEDKAKALIDSSTLKKYCIKSTQIKEWFTKKLKDNTNNIKTAIVNVNNVFGGLHKGEQWILDQTKVLKSKIDEALKKLNGQYVVSAMCILDNDKALQKFIQHPNLHQSKLLFHGTYLDALGSIYETGLQHGGGAVYGHGSYLTSSPIHSINYMICYKSGKSKHGEYTLIAAYVNCGNIKQIYDTSYNRKHIQSPYNSHYIASVASEPNKKYLGYPTKYIKQIYSEEYRGNTANEYAIKDPTRILPRFYITLKKVKKDCFAYFTGLIVGDEFWDSNISVAYVVDKYSECVGEGSYPKNREAFPNAVRTTFDGIAIDKGTRVIIWEKENYQGKVWLDQTGPAIINNVAWKSDKRYNGTMTKTFKDKDLQNLYPQGKRFWSVSNMHDWSKGSVKVMSA